MAQAKDGRGEHRKRLSEKNRIAVEKWFRSFPDSTIKECCEALNLSYPTVRKHIDELK